MSITPDEVRCARQLLGWTRLRLVELSSVPDAVVAVFECGAVSKAMNPKRLAAIRAALEFAGVEFTDGDNPGVSRRRAGP